jgi:hypothetical protein
LRIIAGFAGKVPRIDDQFEKYRQASHIIQMLLNPREMAVYLAS